MAKLSTKTQASSILKTYILHIANSGVASYKTTLSFLMDFLELNKNSYEKSITANATGTQASATALTKRYNRVDTAVAGASVKFLQAYAGLEQEVYNNTANDIVVYPFLADKFLNLPINTGITVVSGGTLKIFAYEVLILS